MRLSSILTCMAGIGHKRSWRWRCPTLAALALLLACSGGCGGQAEPAGVVSVWAHAGRAVERNTLEQQVAEYNARSRTDRVKLTFIPEGSYNGQVQAAALAGDLPDVLEFDGPYLYTYVWQGRLRPLDALLPETLRDGLLPSIIAQGTYRGHLYSVGTFDSGLGLWGDRRALEQAGVRIPKGPADAWTSSEFDNVLAALAARDPDGAVLDLKLNYPDEWFTYAFSPLIESAGGDLIDRNAYRTAEGVLNGPAAVRAMRRIQGWFRSGYVDPNLDDAAFVQRRVALAWGGHWNYPRYHKALGNDLVLLPLPRFGPRMVTGEGSWSWGITRRCRRPEAAARFLRYLLQPDQVLAISEANGGVPATRAAIARSPLYGPHSPLRLFAEQLREGYAVPRPRTPAYPTISAAFAQAFRAVRNGVAPKRALDRAVQMIDRDIRDNHGYPDVAVTGGR